MQTSQMKRVEGIIDLPRAIGLFEPSILTAKSQIFPGIHFAADESSDVANAKDRMNLSLRSSALLAARAARKGKRLPEDAVCPQAMPTDVTPITTTRLAGDGEWPAQEWQETSIDNSDNCVSGTCQSIEWNNDILPYSDSNMMEQRTTGLLPELAGCGINPATPVAHQSDIIEKGGDKAGNHPSQRLKVASEAPKKKDTDFNIVLEGLQILGDQLQVTARHQICAARDTLRSLC